MLGGLRVNFFLFQELNRHLMLSSSQLEDLIKNSQHKEAELQVGSTDSNQMSVEYLSCFSSSLVVRMSLSLCFVGLFLLFALS